MSVLNFLCGHQDGAGSSYEELSPLERSHSSAVVEDRTSASREGSGFTAGEIRALWRYLETHIHAPISVEQFSKVIGFSQWHFSRCFKAEFGCSPHRFIIAHRIRHATALLINSRLSIAEIALESGFADQAHLGRSFSKHVGLSPGRWRREILSRKNQVHAAGS